MTVKGGASQACAACKYQRRRCESDCPLAPYFPATQPKMFQNAHRLFGVNNILKILKQLNNQQQWDEAMKSVIYESNMRAKFPVFGCYGIICHLYWQLVEATEELHYLNARLAMCRDDWRNNQVVDHHYFSPEMQLGANWTGDALTMQFEANANKFVTGANNAEEAKPYWAQHPNYYFNSNSIAIRSQFIPSHLFPAQQDTEVMDYDDVPFDTMADDRSSYVESREACEFSCESSWKNNAQSIHHLESKNDLKCAAACFSLTNLN